MVLTDLHSAAASADLARLRQRWWLNKHRINACNHDKQTPLHLACINGHADVVQFLVEKKCKLNPCDKLKKSPLMKAVEHQHRDCAAILLEHGADPSRKDVTGNTALHFAVMVSSKSLVELLLEHGADIEAKNKLGYTPLTLAVTENCEEMVEFLIQKGADMNAQDNVFRTPLAIATVSGNKKAAELLLQHGAVLPESDKGLYLCQAFSKTVQDDVIANEQIDGSCYEATPVIPFKTPALSESDDGSKEEAAEKEDSGSASDQNEVSAQTYGGPETKEDKCRVWNPKHLSDLVIKEINPDQSPAGKHSRVGVRSAPEDRGKGVLQPAGGAAREEDTDSSLDSEIPLPRETTNPKSQGRVWTSAWLPAANTNRLDARSATVGCGKGVLPAGSVEAEKEDGDPSWHSKPFPDIVEEEIPGKRLPAADHKAVGVCSAATEGSKGVLKKTPRQTMKEDGVMQPAGGEAKDEDNDSPWDSETDFEGEVSAAVHLPPANSNRMDPHSAAVECCKVLKQACREGMKKDRVLQPAGGEAKDEDNDSPWDSETDFESEVSAAVHLPPANSKRLDVLSAAVKRGKGVLKQACREGMKKDTVLQPAGGEAKDEDNDSPWDSETDFESEVSAAVHLPPANSKRLDVLSAAVERGKGVLKKACREGMKKDSVLQPAGGEAKDEDNDSPWDSETDFESEVSAAVHLPPANSKRLDVLSAAVKRGKGVLKQACREGMKKDTVLQPAGGEAKDEDNDSPWDSETDFESEVSAAVHLPPANSKRLDVLSAAVERGKGVLKKACREGMKKDSVLQPAGGEAKDEDNDSPWDSETDFESEVSAAVHLPPANSKRLDVLSAAVERGKGVLKQACREGMKKDTVLQPAGGEAKDEDNDSPWDSETDFESEVSAAVHLPPANSKRLDVLSAAVKRGKGVLKKECREGMKKDTVLQPAGGEAKDEDNDSPWDSETDFEGEVSAAVHLPPANSKRLDVLSAAVKRGKGVLKQACREGMKKDSVLQPAGGEAKDEDNDSPWDSETDFESEVSAAVHLPPANSKRLDVLSAAVKRGKGVLKQACREGMKKDTVLQPAGGEAKDEDNDSPWDSETDFESEVSAAVDLPPANSKRLDVLSAAVKRGKGVLKKECREGMKKDIVLQPAGGEAKDEDNDSPWDSETDFESEVSAAVHLPPANSKRLDVLSAAVKRGKGVLKKECREGMKKDSVLQPAGGEAKDEDNDSPWDSEADSEGKGKVSGDVLLPAAVQYRVGVISAAVDPIKAARAKQEERFISSSENKLPTLHTEDLQLKVDSSTQTDSEQDKQLKYLKELFHKNDYYAESGNNALQEKKVITFLRSMQGRLVDYNDSSVATIRQQKEHIQRLQIQMARLEATIQQQVKTIEVLETIQQVSYRSKLLRAFPVLDPQSLAHVKKILKFQVFLERVLERSYHITRQPERPNHILEE